MRFAFISEEKVAFPIAGLCRVLAVSPSRAPHRACDRAADGVKAPLGGHPPGTLSRL